MKPLEKIRKKILFWYSKNGRDLPWRKTHNPYKILVSEIMLQQTQVSRVLEKYPGFLKRFSSFRSLARAKTSSVIRAWRGMGYNNRAVRIQELAKTITKKFNGRLPKNLSQLEALPGIGPYTARAVACFAFNQRHPVVDTNIRRVLARLFPEECKKRGIWRVAEGAMPARNAYNWNQSLMDLGAIVCSAANPKCFDCPVNEHCPSAFRTQSKTKHIKREPGRNGIPNRIHRGRIVEILRNAQRPVSASVVGKRIASDFHRRDLKWLHRLLTGLEKDGLIRTQKNNTGLRVSLPQ